LEKILIIDDDTSIRETLKGLLQDEYKVIIAENGNKGIPIFFQENPNLVISGLKMEGMDGLHILKKIKESATETPVILITAFDEIQLCIEAIQAGAYDFLGKPLDIQKFKNCVKKALRTNNLHHNSTDIVAFDTKDYKIESNLVAKTPEMKEIVHKIGHVSSNRINILIQGESGTGKELIAKLIHYSGITKNFPFVPVNCSALTESLLESEMFGHVKGSFTDAYRDKKGKFEIAGEGTLFLDEISEVSPATQVKLLRVLQEREFERVGGEDTIPLKARIIAATNKDLEDLVKKGKFREDLFYRLKVFLIEIPPLRKRKDAIPHFVIHFVNRINKELNKNIRKIPYDVMEMLMKYDWIGNVRELENTLYQAIVLSHSDVLEKENILIRDNVIWRDEHGRSGLSLNDVEKEHIKLVLGKVNNDKQKAAKILGISLATLYTKISSYNL
jgi:DNA-binding NtrC family response regulator